MTRAAPPIRDRRVRFALVGCGRIAKSHFAALAGLRDRAELVAVCDSDPRALDEATAANAAAGYDSLTALLAQSEPDVVVLATPSGLHAEQTIQIAQAGRHVMTEKPMATRWHDGKRMVQACDTAGVRLLVVKQNRYNATLQLAKRAVESHRFGRIYMVTVNVFWTRPQSYFDSAKWRGTWEFAEPAPEDELVKKASYATPSVYGFGHSAYYDNVIKVLSGDAEPQTDGREGLRSLEILIAIYRSARDGTRVSLPLEY